MISKVMGFRDEVSDRLPEAFAWFVHFYTALGVAASFFALIAVYEGHASKTFWLLGLALFIDGTDGILARRADVHKWTSQFNGRKLDDIIDYLNYVFIPMFFAYRFELVTGVWVWVLAFVLIASAYGFCHEAAKTHDGYFTGFPSDWNVVVFYMFVMKPSPEFNAIFLLVLGIMVFIPLKYLYPTQMPSGRKLNILFAFIWSAALMVILANFENPNPILVWVSLIYPAYYLLASFYANVPQVKSEK